MFEIENVAEVLHCLSHAGECAELLLIVSLKEMNQMIV